MKPMSTGYGGKSKRHSTTTSRGIQETGPKNHHSSSDLCRRHFPRRRGENIKIWARKNPPFFVPRLWPPPSLSIYCISIPCTTYIGLEAHKNSSSTASFFFIPGGGAFLRVFSALLRVAPRSRLRLPIALSRRSYVAKAPQATQSGETH